MDGPMTSMVSPAAAADRPAVDQHGLRPLAMKARAARRAGSRCASCSMSMLFEAVDQMILGDAGNGPGDARALTVAQKRATTVLTWVLASMESGPSSRPMPDCL